jgi:two-component system, NarL family, invasion response regulator UvrY
VSLAVMIPILSSQPSMFERLLLGPMLIVDDHPIIVRACRLILGDTETIVAARDVKSGYEAFLAHRPDVVVVDLSLHGDSLAGIALIRRIRMVAPLAPILVYSMHADPNIATSAMEAGATGYLIKDSSPDELTNAVRLVRSGLRYVDERVWDALAQGDRNIPLDLTPREQQVLSLLESGKPNSSISNELGITRKTVARIISQVKRKVGARGIGNLLRRDNLLAPGNGNDHREASV